MSLPHGQSKYEHEHCRCDVCRAGHAARVLRRRRERMAQVAVHGLPETVQHGVGGYRNWGCRCAVCTEAHRVACAAYNTARKQRQAAGVL